jgi:hypothetical protein
MNDTAVLGKNTGQCHTHRHTHDLWNIRKATFRMYWLTIYTDNKFWATIFIINICHILT